MEKSRAKLVKFLLLALGIAGGTILLRADLFLRMLEDKTGIVLPFLKTAVGGTMEYRNVDAVIWDLVKGRVASAKTVPTVPAGSPAPARASAIAIAASAPLPDPGPILKRPCTFLILGGSAIRLDLGPRVEKDLEALGGISVVRLGRVSSGLTDPKVLDWPMKAKELMDTHKPAGVVCYFGANDGTYILDASGKRVAFDDPSWEGIYEAAVDRFMGIVGRASRVYWIELPITNDARFNQKFLKMNAVYERVAARHPSVVFVPTWERFAPQGVYAARLADDEGKTEPVKEADGVHFTQHGAKIASSLLLPFVKDDLGGERGE